MQQEGKARPHDNSRANVPVKQFDTTNQIDLHYRALQRMAGKNPDAPANVTNPQQRFLIDLNRLVRLEYKQYVKSEDPVYTRKNLREIMQAISQEVSQLQPREKRDRKAERMEEALRAKKLNMRRMEDIQEIFKQKKEEQQPTLSQVA